MKNTSRVVSIWIIITAFYCFQYILRLLPNLIMPELMHNFAITAEQLGTFAGIYYIGYVGAHIPIGLLISRYGGKLMLPAAILLSIVGLVPLLMGNSWPLVVGGRMLTGIGSSAAIIGAFQFFRILFPKNFSRMLGLFVFVGIITAVSISKPLTLLLAYSGMHAAITALIGGGVILATLTLILLPRENLHSSQSLPRNALAIFGNWKLLVTSACAGLMVGLLEGFPDAWASGFLTTVYNMNRATADSIVFLILVGMCIGSILLPYVADKLQRPYEVTIFSGIMMMITFFLLLAQYSENQIVLSALFLIIGIFCAYQVVILSKISTLVPPSLSGFAGSVGNMIIMGFGYFFHKGIGTLMDYFWDGTISKNVRVYNSAAYIKSLSFIELCLILAIAGLLLIMISEKLNRTSGKEK